MRRVCQATGPRKRRALARHAAPINVQDLATDTLHTVSEWLTHQDRAHMKQTNHTLRAVFAQPQAYVINRESTIVPKELWSSWTASIHLTIVGQRIDFTPLQSFARLSTLKIVVSEGISIDTLPFLPHLEELDFHAEFPFADLNFLRHTPNLRRLSLVQSKISAEPVSAEPLGELTQLQDLHLCHLDFTDLGALQKLVNVERSDWVKCMIPDLDFMKTWTRQHTLTLFELLIKSLEPLVPLTQLTSLTAVYCSWLRNISCLKRHPNYDKYMAYFCPLADNERCIRYN